MKKLGVLEREEKEEIEKIYYRKVALENLVLVLQERYGSNVEIAENELYQKLVQDMSETIKQMGIWWNQTSNKYQWKFEKTDNWEVKFDTGEVFLFA